MTNLPKGFCVESVHCFPVGSGPATRFAYIPGAPRVEVSEDGDAEANLLISPERAVLSIQTAWCADAGALTALDAEIRERYPDLSEWELSQAPLSEVTATLTVTATDDAARVIGPKQASGMAANRVVLNETLSMAEKHSALSAIEGQEGLLMLSYKATLNLPESVTAHAAGDLGEDVQALAPKSRDKQGKKKNRGWFRKAREKEPEERPLDLTACAGRIDSALNEGRLALTIEETAGVSADLRSSVETKLRDQLARQLYDQVKQHGANARYISSFTVNQTATDGASSQYSIERSADLGAWFEAYQGRDVVSHAGDVI